MKPAGDYIVQAIRVFLGAFYLTSGLNYFLLFFPQPRGRGITAEYVDIVTRMNVFPVVKALDIVTGVCLIMNWFTPLILILLFPVTFQIFYLTFFNDRLMAKWNHVRNFTFHCILFFAYFRHFSRLFDLHPSRTPLQDIGRAWRDRRNGETRDVAI
jgi:hypothetical protein